MFCPFFLTTPEWDSIEEADSHTHTPNAALPTLKSRKPQEYDLYREYLSVEVVFYNSDALNGES